MLDASGCQLVQGVLDQGLPTDLNQRLRAVVGERPQALANAQGIAEWPLRAVPIPGTGNDQFTLTLT